ncbi:MAG: HyaD/HybD family hydrogenase maturation endopeptidase [Pseudomonadota bacterium]
MRDGLDVLVLGVGNILWADEGFGVRCAEHMAAQFDVPDGVEIMDGGTQGLALVNDLAEARHIIIFDAVDAGLKPAELVTVRGEDVPKFAVGKKVSLHQTSMMELLALAEFIGDAPEAITLIGCQPVVLEDYGGGLTEDVAAQVASAIQAAVEELKAWGFEAKPAKSEAAAILPEAVGWKPYEANRPDADAACRIGDDRVLARLPMSGG